MSELSIKQVMQAYNNKRMELIPLKIAQFILNNPRLLTLALTVFPPQSLGARFISDILVSAVRSLQNSERALIEAYQAKAILKLFVATSEGRKFTNGNFQSSPVRRVSSNAIFELLTYIPVLTREEVKVRFEDLKTAHNMLLGYKLYTSGSSGSPMGFLIDSSLFAERAFIIDYMLNCLSGTRQYQILRLAYDDMPWSRYQGMFVYPFRAEIREIKSILASYKPNVLYGTVSRTCLFAEYLRSHGFHYQFDIVLTRSEHLTASTRAQLEDYFHAKVYNIYASREFGPIGQECRYQDGFHINEDRFFVEIVDRNNRSVPDSQVGNILITSLHSKSFPFIRYAIGDKGAFVGGPCPCGLETKRLTFVGRTCDFIQLSDGKKFPVGDLFVILFNEIKSIRAFQIIQESQKIITVKVVLEKPLDETWIAGSVKRRFINLIDPSGERRLQMKVKSVANIPLLPSGKHQTFISRLAQNT